MLRSFVGSDGIVQSEERLRIGVMNNDERSGASFFMQKTPMAKKPNSIGEDAGRRVAIQSSRKV